MAYYNLNQRQEGIAHANLSTDEGGLRAPTELGLLGKAWWWFHFAILVKLARLRFIAVLAGVGGVIAYWDTLNAYYEKWTRPLLGLEANAVSDAEYSCPMHPTIVRDHADNCPICAMPLSKRKKGEKADDEALPPGIVSRVQLTPYKVAVAGIETTEIGYKTLTKDIAAVGFVEFDERRLARITARATGKSRIEMLHVNVTGQGVEKGQALAELYSPDLLTTVDSLLDARRSSNRYLERLNLERLTSWGIDQPQLDQILQAGKPVTHLTIRSPIAGQVIRKYQVEGEYVEEGARLYDVADLSSVWIEAQVYEDEVAFLKEGMAANLTLRAFPGRTYSGAKLALVQPHLDAATRTVKVRFDMANPHHDLRPGMFAIAQVQVSATELTPDSPDAGEKQKQSYQAGQVLAVPERAVIDTGSHKFVYREAEPDTYEGVEVELGPRCGGFYPVHNGLQAGDRVATTGSFLIDAETRLTGASGMYFGASGGRAADHQSSTITARPSMTRDEDTKVRAGLAKLTLEDRRLAKAQGVCPVLNTELGSMGVPIKVILNNLPVFVCCKGCVKKARADEQAVLDKVADLKTRPKKGSRR
jgi:multidrug efflux pump subunit AcrA (membrane-fusion protein)